MCLRDGEVVVAMSGGVDSSVAAHLLRQAGCAVSGVFFRLAPDGEVGGRALRHADDARRVADALGVDLAVIDASAEFAGIIDYFAGEYARGRTPNPCAHCNVRVKFARLLVRADRAGARYVATGHHARMVSGAIHRSGEKDQSYALFALRREVLGRVLLPVGGLGKAEVRRIAAGLGLPVADKPDSQDICFVAGDYAELVRARRPEAFRPGDVVDSAGNVLGRHRGVGHFTVGQRRGLGIAAGRPVYVTRIDADKATVTVGPAAEVLSRALSAGGANWQAISPRTGETFDAAVQIRYNSPPAPGRVRITGSDRFEVEFAAPVTAVAPGQAAVVYDGDRLLGGGWID